MSTNPKCSTLLELGGIDRSEEWIDYLKHGFTCEDLPDLLNIIADKSLYIDDEERQDIWGPIHAWRTIGQLGCESAITPLIDLFDQLNTDDWACIELPKVIGMTGATAIDLLTSCLHQPNRDEYSRFMASESLKQVALHFPNCRDRVVSILTDYLKMPDVEQPELNAAVVADLIDLSATESIETIRKLYANDLADLAHCGDIEEVEIALGLRESRSTPKPNYFKDSPIQKLYQPSSDDPQEVAEFYLDKYGSDDSILDVSELDGFFTALACNPELIIPSVWMPTLWGAGGMTMNWANTEEPKMFTSAVMTLYNQVMASFHHSQFEALFMERTVDSKTYLIVDEWCHGFMRGLDLWPDLSTEGEAFLQEQTAALKLFCRDEGFEQLKTMSEDEIEQAQHNVEPAVQVIYDHFEGARKQQQQPIQRKEAKVGRNDPCPCGSGKKFKKCCLH